MVSVWHLSLYVPTVCAVQGGTCAGSVSTDLRTPPPPDDGHMHTVDTAQGGVSIYLRVSTDISTHPCL